MTPSMDHTLDLLNPKKAVTELVEELTTEYKAGHMRKSEYLEELEGIINREWETME